MNGYGRLNSKEADLLWDRERFDLMPEQERELILHEVEKLAKVCNLYKRCSECPNVKDCMFFLEVMNES